MSQSKAITESQIERFIAALEDTVTTSSVTVEIIQRCLPMLGELHDNGYSPDEVLPALLPLQYPTQQ